MNGKLDGPLIVGFGHRRRVGKDTLAGMVRDRLRAAGITVFRDAFAWKLKDVARKVFGYAGLGPADLYEREPERREIVLPAIGKTPRQIWIEVGNKLREVAPDVWIRGVLDNPAYGPGSVLVLSDIRYPNEIEAIRTRGGLAVKVLRPDVPESTDVADSALAGMPDGAWDHIVHNSGSMGLLATFADRLADLIRNRLASARG